MQFDSLLRDFDAEGSVRHGLPGAVYTSDDFLQLENQHLFANNWVFVGFAHELAKTGDVRPIETAGLPLFLLRDQQQKIVAFHNICRHRNLKLIDKSGNCGRLIRCPYHCWGYDLRGQLKNTPYFGGNTQQLPADFRHQDHGLIPIHCEV